MRRKISLAVRGVLGVTFFMMPTIITGLALYYAALLSRGGKVAYGGEWVITGVIALYNVSLICKMLNKRDHKEVGHGDKNQRRIAAARQSHEYANHKKRAC